MSYVAPVKDIAFLLNHVVGLDKLARLDGFEEASADLVEAILEESAKFTADVLAPLNWVGDQQGSQWNDGAVTTPEGWKEAYTQFVESGWGSLSFPTEFGGQGLPMTVAAAV
ncbi:MAG: acyl-CoA dehydrogenase N-terminal domain-containing protein, partial [Granulosicoccus sp.]